jgi:hypothetical protein
MSKPFIMWDFGLGSGWVGFGLDAVTRVGRVRCGNVETQYFASPGMGWGSGLGFGFGSMRERGDAKYCVSTPPPDCCEFPFKFQLFFIVPIDGAAISVHSWPTMNRYTLLNSGMKDKGE